MLNDPEVRARALATLFPFFHQSAGEKVSHSLRYRSPFFRMYFLPALLYAARSPSLTLFHYFSLRPPRASLFKTLFSPLLYVFFLPSSPRARASARGPRHAYVFVCELSPV